MLPVASFATEAFDPDGLIAGSTPIHDAKVTLLSGQNLKRGAVLGKITSSGKYVLSLAASEDDSEDPVAILAVDCDATGGDAQALVYTTGDFAERRLIFGTGHTAASIKEGLRSKGIYLISSQGA